MTATATEVATTILVQLGGRRFAAMTGAKLFSATDVPLPGLTFRLPANFARNGINVVTIVLTPADTYTVTFGKLRGLNYKVLRELEDVYAEDLQRVFREETGLDTHL